MLRAVAQWAVTRGVPCQVSVETPMACGVGLCMGCAVATPDKTPSWKLACVHGPVFDAQEIVLEETVRTATAGEVYRD